MLPPHYWSAFKTCEPRIRLFAARRAQRSRRYIDYGGEDNGELEVDALINSVFERILTEKAVWLADEKTFLAFFCEQVHNRVRALEQKSVRPHLRAAPSRSDDGRATLDELVGAGDAWKTWLKESVTRALALMYHRNADRSRIAALYSEGFDLEQIRSQSGYSLSKIADIIAEFKDTMRSILGAKR